MKQTKLSLGARFGLAVASFFLSLLLIVAAVATTLIADVQVITSEGNLKQIIHQTLSAPAAPKKLNAPFRADGVTFGGGISHKAPIRLDSAEVETTNSLVAGLVEQLYKELDNLSEEPMPITQEELTDLIDQSTVKDYIAEKSASLLTDYYTGEITTTFEAEEIVTLIQENADLIEQVIGEPLPEEYTQDVATWFDENETIQVLEEEGLAGLLPQLEEQLPDNIPSVDNPGNPDVKPAPSPSTPSAPATPSIPELVSTLRSLTSTTNLIIGIAVCLLLMAAIVLVNIKQLPRGLRRSGYPLLFVGLLFVACLVVQFTPHLWQTRELALVRTVLLMTTGIHAIAPALGIVMVVVGIVLGVICKKKARSAAIAEASSVEETVAEEVAVAEEPVVMEEAPVSEEAAETVEEAAETVEEAVEEIPTEEAPQEETPAEV